jgi:hypothetical protein
MVIEQPMPQSLPIPLALRKIVFSHAANQGAHVVTEPNEAGLLRQRK